MNGILPQQAGTTCAACVPLAPSGPCRNPGCCHRFPVPRRTRHRLRMRRHPPRRPAAFRQPERPPASAEQRFARSRLIQQESAGDRYNPPVPSDAHGSRERHACVTTLGIIASFVPASRLAWPGARRPLAGAMAVVRAWRGPAEASRRLHCHTYRYVSSAKATAQYATRPSARVRRLVLSLRFVMRRPSSTPEPSLAEPIRRPRRVQPRAAAARRLEQGVPVVFCRTVSRVVFIAMTALSPPTGPETNETLEPTAAL